MMRSAKRQRTAPCLRGAAAREQWFTLARDVTFLNHGSYGATPRAVMAAQQALAAQMEANPDAWFRRAYKPLLEPIPPFSKCAILLVFVAQSTSPSM